MRKKDELTAYTMKGIDRALWRRVRAKADAEGRETKWVVLRLLELWVDGKIDV